MGNALAIAAVTASLRGLLDYALNGNEALVAALGEEVAVTAASPEQMAEAVHGARLNVYLFQVTPNTAARNAELPRGVSSAQARPPLALDLKYLISAQGEAPFAAEMLLGHAMNALHETPVLSRDLMRNVLALPGARDVPERIKSAMAAGSQAEQLKLTPLAWSPQEYAQLWPALQTPALPSIVYLVSTVML